MLFMDVTHRCNQDCPMCGSSLRGMGFEFIPHSIWYPYRNAILRKIADKYGTTRNTKKAT